MDPAVRDEVLNSLDRRVSAIEQKLPTLVTKEDLKALATKEELKALATKEELRAAIAPLATREQLREESERTRRHMTVLYESLQDDIRKVAGAYVALDHRDAKQHREVSGRADKLDLRVTALEVGRRRRRSS